MALHVPADKISHSPITLKQYAALDMAARKKIWVDISEITAQELDAHLEQENAREAIVPQPGQPAPEFVADLLDRDKKRTGATVRLSDLRGKPVGIVFGSFT